MAQRTRKKRKTYDARVEFRAVPPPRPPAKPSWGPVVARLEKNAPFSHDKDVDIKDLV